MTEHLHDVNDQQRRTDGDGGHVNRENSVQHARPESHRSLGATFHDRANEIVQPGQTFAAMTRKEGVTRTLEPPFLAG